MRQGHHAVKYRAMPAQARFGWFSRPFTQEACYTQEELQFRKNSVNARANSGLDKELLRTNLLWFSDDSEALINVNEGSWVLGSEFRPKQELCHDDFHVALVTNERLNWPGLSILMRNIGDYLLIRNSELAPAHLNQPMNYILLDVVEILSRLAIIERPNFVAQQLQLLINYIRVIETHVSPMQGSDRAFLVDCVRSMGDHIKIEIEQKLESKQLKSRLQMVKQYLNKVAELRHTILHFALASKEVNPHPYWEHFTQPMITENSEFPTLTARNCAKPAMHTLSEYNEDSPAVPVLELNAELLAICDEFKFVEPLARDAKEAYGKSVMDLQEIVRFQGILDKLLQLLEQAGEVFTFIQFREQMLTMLQSIEKFIQHSDDSITQVLDANTKIYRQFIQDKQDLRWWEKVVTNKQELIDNFISNQDNLARFAASNADLRLANKELIEQVNQVVSHLTQQGTETLQIGMVSATQEIVNHLMISMHAWAGHQQKILGLPLPPKPKLLMHESAKAPSNLPLLKQKDTPQIEIKRGGSSPEKLDSSLQFWAHSTSSQTSLRNTGLRIEAPTANQDNDIMSQGTLGNSSLALGVLVLLPIGVLVAYLLLKRNNATTPKPCLLSKDEKESRYKTFLTEIEDKLTQANQLAYQNEDKNWQEIVDNHAEDLNTLKRKACRGQINLDEVEDLLNTLTDFIEDINKEPGMSMSYQS